MQKYETIPHGTPDFPVGVHTTAISDGFRLYPHIHREFELLVLTRGCGRLLIDGEEFLLRAGSGIFVNSRQLHLGLTDEVTPCEFFAIVFAPELLGQAEGDRIMHQYVTPVLSREVVLPILLDGAEPWQKRVLALAAQIRTTYMRGALGFEPMVKALLLQVWSELFVHRTQGLLPSAQTDIEGIKSAMEFIRENYAQPLTLQDMATAANMSRSHFCRRFSAVMQVSPFTYLTEIRIDNARRMLCKRDMVVSQIAALCGFNSFSYFSVRFKAVVGCSPSDYAKRHRHG